MSVPPRLVTTGRCLLAGLCLVAAVPPWGWWPLAIVGIALWDQLLADQPVRARAARSWLVGAAWLFPGFLWMWALTPPGYLVAGSLYAAYFAAAGAAVPPGRGRWLALPGTIVLAEAARWAFPFGGVPLATLAMSQADAPLLAVARLGGAISVVAAVVIAGVAVSAAWSRKWVPAAGAAVVVVCLGLLGVVAPRGATVGTIDVALVQGGGEQGVIGVGDRRQVFEDHLEASELIEGPVDLVIWPENTVGVEGPLDENPEDAELAELARELDAPLLVGATEGLDEEFLNAVIVYDAEGQRVDRFDKVRRVPFGEYVPFRPIIERFGEGTGLPRRDARPGTGLAVVDSPVGPLGVVVSWEVFFSDRAAEAIGNGGEVLVNPTNGSSYWLTQVQSQQVASSSLRAVETGRWVVQAAPTGFTAVVDPAGNVLERTDVSERRVVQATVERREGETLPVRFGPWPTLLAAAIALGGGWAIQRRDDVAAGEPASRA